jgi:DNA-binding NarL/FixJ family response regulator
VRVARTAQYAFLDTNKIPSSSGASSRPQKRHPRVFVVDDALVVRNLVIECIEEVGGLEVAGFAGSEASALSWLRSHACDVLILDLELRQGTGLGVLKYLASIEPARKPVTIVFSNHADETSRRSAMQLDAAYFFDKTSDADKLRPLLQDISAQARDR